MGQGVCCRRCCLIIVISVILLCSCSVAHAQRQLQANSTGPGPPDKKADYVNVFVAMLGLPEGQIVRDTYLNTFKAMSEGSPFQPILDLAQNSSAPATYFWPEDSAWEPITEQLCMSVKKIQDTLASYPALAAQYIMDYIVPGKTVMQTDFTEGLTLQSMEEGFKLKMAKRIVDGKPLWYFPGVAFNRTNVTIIRTDITAGSAVIHFLDTPILSEPQRKFWSQQQQNIGEQGCAEFRGQVVPPSTPTSAGNAGMIAGIVIAAVVAVAALLVAGWLLLVRKHPLQQRLSGAFGIKSQEPPHTNHQDIETPPTQVMLDSRDLPVHKDVAVALPLPPDTVSLPPAHLIQAPVTPLTTSSIVRTPSTTGESDTSSQPSHWVPEREEAVMTPVFEANPVVPPAKLESWVKQCTGRGKSGSSSGEGETSSSGSSGRAAVFAEQLRRELDSEKGNPNIINNYTAFTREVEHSSTAVYFCEGMHNNRQFALKFYARRDDFEMEMRAYKELGGPQSKFVPVLEMSYPGNGDYPTSVLVFERGQCTLEAFARQRPSYFQQIDIFHQLVSAVQHLHDQGVVHRDMKPSNVVHFPEKFAWKLIDLATIARTGEITKIVYTREYCSPEVARAVVSGAASMTVEPASDLWGVGVIMYELATGHRYFPPDWSLEGGRRIWSALCGFEPLPHEMTDITQTKGADRGVMKLVRRLLQRDPRQRPIPRQLLGERLFQARGNTTTQISQGSNVSHGSAGSGHFNL